MLKKVVFLIGSPKSANSTSTSICDYLSYLLAQKDFEIEKLHIHTLLGAEKGCQRLFSSIATSDVIIFSSPLYIDCIPYEVTKFLEMLAEHLKKIKNDKKQKMMAISNCGFPEASQNNVALQIYKNFAKEVGFEWIGGLSFCMGAALNGVSIRSLSLLYPNIRKAFKQIADAISAGTMIPDDAITLAAKPFAPKWIYIWLGNNIIWKLEGLKFGVFNLYNMPYSDRQTKGLKNA